MSSNTSRRERGLWLGAGLSCVLCACLADQLLGGQKGFGQQQWLLLGAGLLLSLLAGASRRVRRAALALLGASALALLGAEGAARLLWRDRYSTIYELDPVRHYRLISGSQKLFVHRPSNGSREVFVRVNSAGMRGPELDPSAAERRIVVYGDSCIAGEYSSEPETLVGQLAQEFGGSIEVLNAGIVGYGPDQCLQRMRSELSVLRPKLAIVALFADNDLGDLLRNKLYRLDDAGKLVAHAGQLSAQVRGQLELARRGWLLQRAWQRNRSRLATESAEGAASPESERARMRTWLSQSQAEYDEYIVRGEAMVHALFEDHYDADVALAPDSPSALYKLRLCQAIVAEMLAVAAAADVPLLFLLIPSRVDVCADFALGWIDPEEWPNWQRGELARRCADSVRAAGGEALELYEAFRESGDCDLYFRGGDSHWNERGQALAARMLAARIRKEAWLD